MNGKHERKALAGELRNETCEPPAPRERPIVGVEAPEQPVYFETPESMRAPQPRPRR